MQLTRVLSHLRVPLSQRTCSVLTSKYIRLLAKDYSQVTPFVHHPSVPSMMTMRGYCQSTSLPRDVTTEQLVDILDTKSAVVVDVRTAQELSRHGAIPGAINIPLGDLEVQTSHGPEGKKYFIRRQHCQ